MYPGFDIIVSTSLLVNHTVQIKNIQGPPLQSKWLSIYCALPRRCHIDLEKSKIFRRCRPKSKQCEIGTYSLILPLPLTINLSQTLLKAKSINETVILLASTSFLVFILYYILPVARTTICLFKLFLILNTAQEPTLIFAAYLLSLFLLLCCSCFRNRC